MRGFFYYTKSQFCWISSCQAPLRCNALSNSANSRVLYANIFFALPKNLWPEKSAHSSIKPFLFDRRFSLETARGDEYIDGLIFSSLLVREIAARTKLLQWTRPLPIAKGWILHCVYVHIGETQVLLYLLASMYETPCWPRPKFLSRALFLVFRLCSSYNFAY